MVSEPISITITISCVGLVPYAWINNVPVSCGPGVTDALIQSVTAASALPLPGNVIHISEFSVIDAFIIVYCA